MIIVFMQQKNILSERSIMKAFWDSKHGIFACFKRFYTVEEPVPVRCRSAFRNCILLTNSSIFQDPSFVSSRPVQLFSKTFFNNYLQSQERFSGGIEKVIYLSFRPFQLIKKGKVSGGGDRSFLCHNPWYAPDSFFL